MKLKKCKLKRFRSNAGFTLVELIVVIAILAILGGVAVPAYSGYVKKANMGADEALVNEVKQAIQLAYYNDPASFQPGAVILSTDDPVKVEDQDNLFLEGAMSKAFGEDWSSLQLKYDGWTNKQEDIALALNGTSFSDGEGGIKPTLLGSVDNLTGTLSKLMQGSFNIGNYGGFANYLNENGINYYTDPQKAANSVVPYLSMATPADTEVRGQMKASLVDHDNWIVDGKLSIDTALGATVLNAGGDGKLFPSFAATYATMKGFCEWADEKYPDPDQNRSALFDGIPLDKYWDEERPDGPSDVTNEYHVVLALQQALDSVPYGAPNDAQTYAEQMMPLFDEYLSSGAAAKDVEAYFGVIDGIADNKAYILENLDNSTSFYSDRVEYLNTYLTVSVESGKLAAVVSLHANNILEVGIVGMN